MESYCHSTAFNHPHRWFNMEEMEMQWPWSMWSAGNGEDFQWSGYQQPFASLAERQMPPRHPVVMFPSSFCPATREGENASYPQNHAVMGAPHNGRHPPARRSNPKSPRSSMQPNKKERQSPPRLPQQTQPHSKLFEELLKNPSTMIEQLRGHCTEFAKDHRGSRFVQQAIEVASSEEKQCLFDEILLDVNTLIIHNFGNYVIQKFFEIGTERQRLILLQKFHGSVLLLSKGHYSCRVIQKAIQVLPPEMQAEIIAELEDHVLDCALDPNGNHVIQKCVEFADPILVESIIQAILGHVFELAVHPFGCRVVQRTLERCSKQQTDLVLEELLEHTRDLVKNQYGNYVIQHVLEHGQSEHRSVIISHLKGRALVLSQHKFASNVIEKCLSYGSRHERAILIAELYEEDSDLLLLIKDPYGNYVIQKAVDIAEPSQKKVLIYKMKPYLSAARRYKHAKRTVSKVEQYMTKVGII